LTWNMPCSGPVIFLSNSDEADSIAPESIKVDNLPSGWGGVI
jgi:hypothetical protein